MRAYSILGQIVRPFRALAFYCYNKLIHRQRPRVIVRNEFGELLLIRDWSGPLAWSLPGGGAERKEAPQEAARRELQEETGIEVLREALHYVTTLRTEGYEAPIYAVTVAKSQLPSRAHNPLEITHIGWFAPDFIPKISPLTHQALDILADQS